MEQIKEVGKIRVNSFKEVTGRRFVVHFVDAGEESTLMYSVRYYGFTKEDVITHIERYMQVNYDFNYKIEDISKVVVLER